MEGTPSWNPTLLTDGYIGLEGGGGWVQELQPASLIFRKLVLVSSWNLLHCNFHLLFQFCHLELGRAGLLTSIWYPFIPDPHLPSSLLCAKNLPSFWTSPHMLWFLYHLPCQWPPREATLVIVCLKMHLLELSPMPQICSDNIEQWGNQWLRTASFAMRYPWFYHVLTLYPSTS